MSDFDILGVLQGMIFYERELLALPPEIKKRRTQVAMDYCIIWLFRLANRLPENIAQKLDCIDMAALQVAAETIRKHPAINNLKNPEVLQQLIRAANVYRDRLGYPPLGTDGWPSKRSLENANG